MTVIRLYIAVTTENRKKYADCLSGRIDETSVKLVGGVGTEWWGACGHFYYPDEVNRECLAGAEAWYRAVVFESLTGETDPEGNPVAAQFPDGIVAEGNAPDRIPGDPDPGFEAFLFSCGLRRADLDQTGPVS
ncbi:hypothetical protein UFOVP184_42 [uncultured Caudovirales phage]|uniref:Uncharacterized protein n=1 Tax=uncultured Caudovirales phage TaxID=2100421 RepID=A0A6J7WCQ4_9CAUD|nr:hypothetical protein UFOVP184_42 [uncultured Caudovirales phage]